LSSSRDFIDADSVKVILEDEIAKPSLASWIGGTVDVRIMRKYRDWKQHNDRFAPTTLDSQQVVDGDH